MPVLEDSGNRRPQLHACQRARGLVWGSGGDKPPVSALRSTGGGGLVKLNPREMVHTTTLKGVRHWIESTESHPAELQVDSRAAPLWAN